MQGCTSLSNALLFTALFFATLYCSTLHCTELHCTALHCTALHCTGLHCTLQHCNALNYTALHCNVLHSTALYWTKEEEKTPNFQVSILTIIISLWLKQRWPQQRQPQGRHFFLYHCYNLLTLRGWVVSCMLDILCVWCLAASYFWWVLCPAVGNSCVAGCKYSNYNELQI